MTDIPESNPLWSQRSNDSSHRFNPVVIYFRSFSQPDSSSNAFCEFTGLSRSCCQCAWMLTVKIKTKYIDRADTILSRNTYKNAWRSLEYSGHTSISHDDETTFASSSKHSKDSGSQLNTNTIHPRSFMQMNPLPLPLVSSWVSVLHFSLVCLGADGTE